MNKMFGFKYAAFEFGMGYEIRKIRVAPDGTEYCICYGALITEHDTHTKFKRII
jgi:hypothetical protein